jgi:hypothetical protein
MCERNALVVGFDTAVQEYEAVATVGEQAPTHQTILAAELPINTTLPKPLAGVAKCQSRQLNYRDRKRL